MYEKQIAARQRAAATASGNRRERQASDDYNEHPESKKNLKVARAAKPARAEMATVTVTVAAKTADEGAAAICDYPMMTPSNEE